MKFILLFKSASGSPWARVKIPTVVAGDHLAYTTTTICLSVRMPGSGSSIMDAIPVDFTDKFSLIPVATDPLGQSPDLLQR